MVGNPEAQKSGGALDLGKVEQRPNRRAVKVGYLLFFTALAVLVTGLLLTRIDIFHFKNVGLKDPRLRSRCLEWG